MKVLLAQKLREFRKKQGLTQEQLAEAMGVTVGAVSKWESGASTPDVSLILELADFFETSVDVLLGYTQQSASLEGSVCRLRDLRIQKDYAAAFREAEKALQRFPNNFQVVYECARIYQLSGLENRDTAALARCQELYRRSLELISQNEDREISPVSIYIAMANAMHSAGDKEGALKLLKEYNVEGVNNAEIGTILAKEQETSEESLTYLTRALLNAETAMLQFSVGYANACLHLDRPAQALEFNRLLYQFIQGLKIGGVGHDDGFGNLFHQVSQQGGQVKILHLLVQLRKRLRVIADGGVASLLGGTAVCRETFVKGQRLGYDLRGLLLGLGAGERDRAGQRPQGHHLHDLADGRRHPDRHGRRLAPLRRDPQPVHASQRGRHEVPGTGRPHAH